MKRDKEDAAYIYIYIYNGKYSTMKIMKWMLFAATWTDLEIIVS